MNGLQFAENHDIRANLNILNRQNIEIPYEKELCLMVSTLYSWETKSRYKESFIAAINDIDKVIKIANELIEYSCAQINRISVEEVEFPDWKL